MFSHTRFNATLNLADKPKIFYLSISTVPGAIFVISFYSPKLTFVSTDGGEGDKRDAKVNIKANLHFSCHLLKMFFDLFTVFKTPVNHFEHNSICGHV